LRLAPINATVATSNTVSEGFAPVIGDTARVLILGSLPSQLSLTKQEYYANPRNAFWRIMREFVGFSDNDSYEYRCNTLINKNIALWDVLASSLRPGSLDSAIDVASATENNFSSLFEQHPRITLICFNGKKARELFDRLVLCSTTVPEGCKLVDLPSSSAAHAVMNLEQKLERWSIISQHLENPVNE